MWLFFLLIQCFRAVCCVEGGPNYMVELMGESAFMQYKLEKRILEFGLIPYENTVTREFHIYNTGHVPFSYSINYKTCSKWIRICPSSGSLNPGQQQKINVHLKPVVPEKIEGRIFVQIAHFPPGNVCLTFRTTKFVAAYLTTLQKISFFLQKECFTT